MWYLRASSVDECARWVQSIETQRNFYQNTCLAENGSSNSSVLNCPAVMPSAASATGSGGPSTYGDNLHRHESALSLSSITSCRSYKEQLSEMETFRTILYQQIKTLQHYFDSSLQSTSLVNEHLKRHRRHQSMNGELYSVQSSLTPSVACSIFVLSPLLIASYHPLCIGFNYMESDSNRPTHGKFFLG